MDQCAFQASAAANNIALLSHFIVRLSEQPSMPSEASEEIGKAASTALTLCVSVTVSTARIAAWVTQIQSHLWLQQASVPETARKVLLDAPISPDGLSVNKLQSLRHSSVPDIPPTHGHNKPTSADITPRVDSTAHTSTHPLSVYAPHDESRSETQCVEAPSQPFRSRPILGCLTGSGGEGSGVACHHDDHSTSRACMNGVQKAVFILSFSVTGT